MNIPLFDFDEEKQALLMPSMEQNGIDLPDRAVIAFLGDDVEKYAIENNFEKIGHYHSIVKDFLIYKGNIDGIDFVISEVPVGAPFAVSIMEYLIECGVKKIIATGSCGVIEDIDENVFLVPTSAIRDEGTSFHYMEPSMEIELDFEPISIMEQIFKKKNLPFIPVKTWTTDGYFRETKKKIEKRKKEGAKVVEMECSALAAVARFRNVKFGQLLFSADNMSSLKFNDLRGEGKNSHTIAIKLAIETLINIR